MITGPNLSNLGKEKGSSQTIAALDPEVKIIHQKINLIIKQLIARQSSAQREDTKELVTLLEDLCSLLGKQKNSDFLRSEVINNEKLEKQGSVLFLLAYMFTLGAPAPLIKVWNRYLPVITLSDLFGSNTNTHKDWSIITMLTAHYYFGRHRGLQTRSPFSHFKFSDSAYSTSPFCDLFIAMLQYIATRFRKKEDWQTPFGITFLQCLAIIADEKDDPRIYKLWQEVSNNLDLTNLRSKSNCGSLKDINLFWIIANAPYPHMKKLCKQILDNPQKYPFTRDDLRVISINPQTNHNYPLFVTLAMNHPKKLLPFLEQCWLDDFVTKMPDDTSLLWWLAYAASQGKAEPLKKVIGRIKPLVDIYPIYLTRKAMNLPMGKAYSVLELMAHANHFGHITAAEIHALIPSVADVQQKLQAAKEHEQSLQILSNFHRTLPPPQPLLPLPPFPMFAPKPAAVVGSANPRGQAGVQMPSQHVSVNNPPAPTPSPSPVPARYYTISQTSGQPPLLTFSGGLPMARASQPAAAASTGAPAALPQARSTTANNPSVDPESESQSPSAMVLRSGKRKHG